MHQERTFVAQRGRLYKPGDSSSAPIKIQMGKEFLTSLTSKCPHTKCNGAMWVHNRGEIIEGREPTENLQGMGFASPHFTHAISECSSILCSVSMFSIILFNGENEDPAGAKSKVM